MEKLKAGAPKMPNLKERGLLSEMSALRNDWLKTNAVVLENKNRAELKEAIASFYQETGPIVKDILEKKGVSLEGELQELSRKHLNAADIQKVREELKLPKWVPLSEAVAFIKTAVDTGDVGIKEKYAEYCAETFSLNDMRSTLAFDNDVKPARIDTDIYHQSPERSRSAVEIVSNAIDALSPEQNSIGRFGVGFYQILAHLKTEHDFVEVKTGSEQDGFYNVAFRLKEQEIQISLTENSDAPTKGTTVKLHSKGFPKEEADALIKKHFAYNDIAKVRCNGELVNDVQKFGASYKEQASISYESSEEGFAVRDAGVGMSPQVILEKLLVPKFSGKRSVHEIAQETSLTGDYLVERRTIETMHEPGKVVVNVGGVLIEEIPLNGVNTPKTLVVNLPPFTTLGEERNQVAIDEITIKATKSLIDKLMASNDHELLNAVAPLIETFQRRSLQHSKDDNLVSFLQSRADEVLPKDISYIPNAPGFDRVKIDNSILLDPSIKKTHWSHIPDLTVLSTTGDGKAVFVGPLREDTEQPLISWKNQIIFDKDLYEQCKNDPTLINLYLDAYGKAEGTDIRGIAREQKNQPNKEAMESKTDAYQDMAEYLEQNWTMVGFDNLNQARAYFGKKESSLDPSLVQTLMEVANKFPPNISAYFVGSALAKEMDEKIVTATRNFLSLAQNPELVSTLGIAGIHGLNMEKVDQEVFPGLRNRHTGESEESLHLPKSIQREWYKVKYWNRDNVIADNGKVYPGRASHLAFGYIPLWNEEEKTYTFLEPTTGQLIDKKISPKYSAYDAKSLEFAGRKLFITDANGYEVYDFDTGELSTLIPKGERILHGSDEKAIWMGGGALLPDGTIISQDQYNQMRNQDKPASFYHNDRVELRVGDKIIYTKYRDAKTAEERKRYEHEEMIGTVIDDAGQRVIVETYSKSKYEFWPRPPEQNEVEMLMLTPDGKTLVSVTSPYLLKTKAVESSDGTKAIRLEEYENGTSFHGSGEFYYTAPSRRRYFNLQGGELDRDQLKNLPPIEYQISQSYVRGLLSPYTSEAWRPEIKIERPENKYQRQNIQLVDTQTNQPLFPERFRSVVYDSAEDVWRCTSLEPAIPSDRSLFQHERNVHKVLVVNREGRVVREEEDIAGDRVYLKGMHSWRYETPDKTSPLSHEKTLMLNRAIHAYDQADRKSIERLVYRALSFGDLSDDTFGKVVPAMAQLEYLDKRLLTEERIKNVSARLQEFDENTQIWCYRLLSQMIHPQAEEADIAAFTERFLLVYREKIAQLPESEKEQIFETFGQLRDYNSEYLATGWTIVQHKSPVPIGQVPEKIRALVDFLRSDETGNLTQSPDRILMVGNHQVTLSQLIQTKRLNERVVQNFDGTADDLEQIVKDKTRGKSQEHIRREIIHPIYYQSVNNPYLFIRELIQNGHDVAIKSSNPVDKKITFDIFSRQGDEVTVRIEDRGGMRLQDVVNYFLIPGESTKVDDKESIGYFGQGVFTLFRDAREVVMQTGVGDGTVNKLRIAPQRNDSGMIVDLDILVEQERGDFKGTIIEKTIATSSPTVEGAFVKNAASTYASLVDSNVVDIFLNGQQLNRPQGKLAELEIPGQGTFAMYDAPNNVVTQRGLFVKAIDTDFKTKMHDVELLLEKRGVVISIPDSISLTRSRNEIARKQEFLPALQEYLPLLKLKAYLEVFRQDIEKGHVIQLENLPYDYYYEGRERTSRKVIQDAQSLREGKPITDVRNYLERGRLIELLVHLPVVEIDDKTYSLSELKKAALESKPPLQNDDGWKKVPDVLRKKLLEGRSEYQRHSTERKKDEEERKNVSDFTLETYDQQPEFVRTQIQKSLPAFQVMDARVKDLNASLSQFIPLFRDTSNTFYYESVSSLAHASPGGNMIGWNLRNLDGYAISRFNKPDVSDAQIRDFYETYSHECAHLLEKSDAFTHNQQFYRQQARALSFLMHAKKRELAKSE